MSLLTLRAFLVLVCVGILASQPFKVSGLRSKDLVLRWDKGHLPYVVVKSFRILKAVPMEDLQSRLDVASSPSMFFDPNQSNNRTVRKVRPNSQQMLMTCFGYVYVLYYAEKWQENFRWKDKNSGSLLPESFLRRLVAFLRVSFIFVFILSLYVS